MSVSSRRIDQTKFRVFRKSQNSGWDLDDFFVTYCELSKTSCFYNHARPLYWSFISRQLITH